MTCFSLFVQFALFAVHVSNRSVHCNSHRETDENPENLYGLFLLVCAFRVVRGSWNSKGVSVVIFTVKWAKTANKNGSFPRKPLIHSQKGLPKGICPKSRATGVFSLSPILPPVVAQNLRKFVLVCFSMFASFALFAVHVFHLECSLSF